MLRIYVLQWKLDLDYWSKSSDVVHQHLFVLLWMVVEKCRASFESHFDYMCGIICLGPPDALALGLFLIK